MDRSPRFAAHDAAGVTSAIGRAHEAFLGSREVPAPRRGELVRLFGEELRAAKHALAALVTIEAGKIAAEARGEVQEMIDICDRDHDGHPELVWKLDPDVDMFEIDTNQDGVFENSTSVERLDAVSSLYRRTIVVDCTKIMYLTFASHKRHSKPVVCWRFRKSIRTKMAYGSPDRRMRYSTCVHRPRR